MAMVAPKKDGGNDDEGENEDESSTSTDIVLEEAR